MFHNNYVVYASLILIGLVLSRIVFIFSKRILFEENIFTFNNICSNCNNAVTGKIFFPLTNYKCNNCKLSILPNCLISDITSVLILVMVYYKFNATVSFIPLAIFAYFLLSASITDFWSKLIPHDITYPAIIIGLVYAYFIKNDVMPALAGIGVSYILFDFIAFYGHKIYIKMHANELEHILAQNEVDSIEEIEVMGGADAVLSAVIASFLGLNSLLLALLIAFLVGAVLGAIYLGIEMYKQKIMHLAIKPVLLTALVTGAVALLLFSALSSVFNVSFWTFYQPLIFFVLAGGLLGLLGSGTKISKPFPFGPALAIGGVIAIMII